MKSLRTLWALWRLYYYRWAQRELQRRSPTHPDLPYILLRRAALERELS